MASLTSFTGMDGVGFLLHAARMDGVGVDYANFLEYWLMDGADF